MADKATHTMTRDTEDVQAWRIIVTEAWRMDEQGASLSWTRWGSDTREYKGYDELVLVEIDKEMIERGVDGCDEPGWFARAWIGEYVDAGHPVDLPTAILCGAAIVVSEWMTTSKAARYLSWLLQARYQRQRLQQMADDPAYSLDVQREYGEDGEQRRISRASLRALAARGLPDRRGRPRKDSVEGG